MSNFNNYKCNGICAEISYVFKMTVGGGAHPYILSTQECEKNFQLTSQSK